MLIFLSGKISFCRNIRFYFHMSYCILSKKCYCISINAVLTKKEIRNEGKTAGMSRRDGRAGPLCGNDRSEEIPSHVQKYAQGRTRCSGEDRRNALASAHARDFRDPLLPAEARNRLPADFPREGEGYCLGAAPGEKTAARRPDLDQFRPELHPGIQPPRQPARDRYVRLAQRPVRVQNCEIRKREKMFASVHPGRYGHGLV